MRYAIYYAPPATSPLWHQGSQWLGRDALSGQSLLQPCFQDIEPDSLAELTRTPAHYGFHATLVPPFRLKEQLTEADLLQGMADFSARQRPLIPAPADRLSSRQLFLPAARPPFPCPADTGFSLHPRVRPFPRPFQPKRAGPAQGRPAQWPGKKESGDLGLPVCV